MQTEEAASRLKEALLDGQIAPWKAEGHALELGLQPPHSIIAAVHARRAFLEQRSGVRLRHLAVPDEPYIQNYRCPQDHSHWWLAGGDTLQRCALCSAELTLEPDLSKRFEPLVQNYIGGAEDYYSYAGEVSVTGSVEKTFQNLLCWGTGIGHLGVSAGCFQLNRFGPIEVQVSDWGFAARNLAFVFDTEAERQRAQEVIQTNLPEIREQISAAHLERWQGKVDWVDFLSKQHHGDRILHVGFYTKFEQHRGHGQTSHAVGMAKNLIDELLGHEQIACRVSVVGMGRDGDLKPSPRNRRGRYASAQQRIPIDEYEQIIGRPIEDFFSYLELDRQGVVEEIGWPAYTGMGGEIIPAFYRAMKTNPRPYLVSCLQKVYTETRGGDLIFGVELPNVEVGITSSPEGIVPPIAREAMRVAGIGSAKEFAAALAAVTLGGEYNFATLHIREKMYTGR